jgi:hypothetical protein
LSAAKALYGFEQALSMDHGKDVNRVVGKFVDQSVAIEEALAYVRVGKFQYDAPKLGMRGKLVGNI